jgi:hypothetical protein
MGWTLVGQGWILSNTSRGIHLDLKGPQKVAQNFGPISIKIGQIVRITKKMTLNKCGPGSGPNYGETAVCSLGREGNKWPKIRFSLYKHPQNGYSPLIIWEKGTFSFGQHCPVVAGTWLESKSGTFFWQNFRSSARKSVFCYRTPDFVNGPFVALGDSFDLAPSD